MTKAKITLEFSEQEARRIESICSWLGKSGRVSEWMKSIVLGEARFQEKRRFGHLPPEHHPSAYPRNVVEREVETAVPGLLEGAE